MLYDYVERKRKENSGAQLHVTYLVAGNLIQNGHVVSFNAQRCLGALCSCVFHLVLSSLGHQHTNNGEERPVGHGLVVTQR